MCRVKDCRRSVFADGLCGFHALQGFYRTKAVPGVGLTATRVGRPRIHLFPEARVAQAASSEDSAF
jgi:hypothetical protein